MSSKMNEYHLRKWDELNAEILSLIFRKLPVLEKLWVIPKVCLSWSRVLYEPFIWEELDFLSLRGIYSPERIAWLLWEIIPLSCGNLLSLRVSPINDSHTASFISAHAANIRTLELPRSNIYGDYVVELAHKLPNLVFLDLSRCDKIYWMDMISIGKSCPLLRGLRRSMHPKEERSWVIRDFEAQVIADHMTNLHYLEMAHVRLGVGCILKLLTCCTQLKLLDIRGVKGDINEEFLKANFPHCRIIGPSEEGIPYYNEADLMDYEARENNADIDDTSDGLLNLTITEEQFEELFWKVFTYDEDDEELNPLDLLDYF